MRSPQIFVASRDQRGDILQMEGQVWCAGGVVDQAASLTGAVEGKAEETVGRSDAGHFSPERHLLKKGDGQREAGCGSSRPLPLRTEQALGVSSDRNCQANCAASAEPSGQY